MKEGDIKSNQLEGLAVLRSLKEFYEKGINFQRGVHDTSKEITKILTQHINPNGSNPENSYEIWHVKKNHCRKLDDIVNQKGIVK